MLLFLSENKKTFYHENKKTTSWYTQVNVAPIKAHIFNYPSNIIGRPCSTPSLKGSAAVGLCPQPTVEGADGKEKT